MAEQGVDLRRRRMLTTTASVVGGAGVVAAAWPFVASMRPSARAQAAGAPVEANIGQLEPGQLIRVKWRGKPVWVVRRTEAMLESLNLDTDKLRDPDSLVASQTPEFARNKFRSIKPEYLVLVGICTHLGCSPTFRPEIAPPDLGPDWMGGFFCPCHGSRFDMAGRVFKGVPAPINLEVPPYRFLSDSRLIIGEAEGVS
ncbi:MAG: ubiquinol-cytochrome c reductase iron-sulfur subunit [Gammaproteobacteria bacterium]|jgi:ubiquinol-cytochrome c reductase iron-sulfur subunit|nr:ubiquinol-cytochrome c reductase iron-sulfur subunit [Gammaproteobacteria bacterium]